MMRKNSGKAAGGLREIEMCSFASKETSGKDRQFKQALRCLFPCFAALKG